MSDVAAEPASVIAARQLAEEARSRGRTQLRRRPPARWVEPLPAVVPPP